MNQNDTTRQRDACTVTSGYKRVRPCTDWFMTAATQSLRHKSEISDIVFLEAHNITNKIRQNVEKLILLTNIGTNGI